MDDFDPFSQTFILLASDGETEIPVSVQDVSDVHHEYLGIAINYGSQIGASFMMLLVLLCITPLVKLAKTSQWVHITALVVSTIRMTLLSVYFTGGFTNFYAFWAYDFSRLSPSDYQISIVSETLSLVLCILIQVALGLQAWAMVSLLSAWWKWFFAVLSAVVSLLTIAFRFAACVMQIRAILAIAVVEPLWLGELSVIFGAVSIFYYCALFNIKLITHLVKNRKILPSRTGLTAMEVLIITNGLLMIIPVIFAGLLWGRWGNFESGSITYTSVVIFLPLGTLIAQRIAAPSSHYGHAGSTGYSGGTPLKSGSQAETERTESNGAPSTVTSRVEGGRYRDNHDHIDAELRQIDSGDLEKGGVRVNREFERREERI